MIDTHCHLEQPVYDEDREVVIRRCQQQLDAVITCCASPADFNLTLQLTRQYPGFIFASASIHPSYVKKISDDELRDYIHLITSNRASIVAIGETGLDYNWVPEPEWQTKQHRLFVHFIGVAQQLRVPLVIHSRDATLDTVDTLEQHAATAVQMHMFIQRSLVQRVLANGWFISVNTLLLRSKGVRKIVRDCPLEQLLLETDSPWLGIGRDGTIKPVDEVRNEPTSVRLVAEKIAEIKKIDLEQVHEQTTRNAINFFKLPLTNL